MSKIFKTVALMLTASVLFISCNKDKDIIVRGVTTATINSDNYTMGGNLVLLYSVDGADYTATIPADIPDGATLMVKVNNGSVDLMEDDFSFDWSGSSAVPLDANAAIASFIANANLTIAVSIADLMSIVTSCRENGRFYDIEPVSGDTTYLFNASIGAESLLAVRGLVYHQNMGLFYVSQTSNEGGKLYTVDPSDKTANVIYENDGSVGGQVWDAIVNWAVMEDDSLIAYGDFNANPERGFTKFGTDGTRADKVTELDMYVGLGMIFDLPAEEVLVATDAGADGTINLDKAGFDGTLTDYKEITDFIDFPSSLSATDVKTRALVENKAGSIYGLLFANNETYFVMIDIVAETVTYISTLGLSNSTQYNVLAYLPKYTL